MAAVVAMEGMTSGLNQVTGGARKYSAALVQTNKLSQEQEELNRNIAYLELVTGPLETMIALQKMATIVSHSETVARIGEMKVKQSLLIVNNSLIASLMVYMVVIIAVIGVIYLLVQAFKHQEEIIKLLKDGVNEVKDAFVNLNRQGREMVRTFAEMSAGATEAMEPLQRIIGLIRAGW